MCSVGFKKEKYRIEFAQKENLWINTLRFSQVLLASVVQFGVPSPSALKVLNFAANIWSKILSKSQAPEESAIQHLTAGH